MRQALARLSVKDAVAEVAAVTGLPRREVYQRALALAKDHDDDPMSVRARAAPVRSAPSRSGRSRSGSACRRRAARRLLLIAKGFRIVARRWRSPVGEIDIVARRGTC